MSIPFSQKGRQLHAEIITKGSIDSSKEIYNAPLYDVAVWDIISKGAKSQDRPPYDEVVRQFMLSGLDYRSVSLWPETLYEVANDLPAISRSECLAILQRFLDGEQACGRKSNMLYLLHWDVLAAHFCPIRERYSVLQQMVKDGLLLESNIFQADAESHIKWPLTITEGTIGLITGERVKHRFLFLAKYEAYLNGLWKNYPTVLMVLLSLLTGGLLVKVLEYGLGWLFDW